MDKQILCLPQNYSFAAYWIRIFNDWIFFPAREWGSCKEDQWRKRESQHWIQATGNPNTWGEWQVFPVMRW